MHRFAKFQTDLIRTFGICSLEEFWNFRLKMFTCLFSRSGFWFFSVLSARIFSHDNSHSLSNINTPLRFDIRNVACFHCRCNDSKRLQHFKCGICMLPALITNITKIWCKIIMTFYALNPLNSMQYHNINISYTPCCILKLRSHTMYVIHSECPL